ncbi:hypothetical protein R1sor_015502 [Riccia sorocarpa]|uniref:Fatty acid 2-hydroxylase n=1 Tax=Riccia sorocarpa TaxID=122646 RepID=A0ABD3HCE7_9MARC
MLRMTMSLQQVPTSTPGLLDSDATVTETTKQKTFVNNAESVDDVNREKHQSQSEELSMKEVNDDSCRKPSLLTVNGKVYDVSSFLDVHPGGADLITEHLNGKDVGGIMAGLDEPGAHTHSKAAMKMLEQFLVNGKSEERKEESRGSEKFQIDLTKPIVPQVGLLGKDYDEWVHTPILGKESPRFYDNDFLESLSRTNWWTIPLVWGPVVVFCQARALQFGVRQEMVVPWMILGAAFWSFFEYLIHRFLFHMKADTYWTATAHYVLHGFHHKHPMDSKRLVFPPAFSSVFVYFFWCAAKVVFGNGVAHSVFGGGLLAYIGYDLTHYFLHYGNGFTNRLQNMKRYHLNHHFKVQTDGYGVTSEFWDWVFGTLPANYGTEVYAKNKGR